MEDKKNIYDVIFVVLTYKTSDDLIDFCKSVKNLNNVYKIIVVDAYYSEQSSKTIQLIAESFDADYLVIDNKGYSYGNNFGIHYANERYSYKFLIVSNPDIQIDNLSIDKINPKSIAVYGPQIISEKGKNQNPFRIIKSNLGEWLNFIGYKYNKYFFIKIYSAFNRIIRILYISIKRKETYQVYSLHGAFVIFTSTCIKKIGQVYNDEMFLFGEEDYLADKLKRMKIPMIYCPYMRVLHKENGSVEDANINVMKTARESYLIYYKDKKGN